MRHPLLSRAVETAFRRLREICWFVSEETDIDRGVSWLADFSTWFREQSGADVGHDLHLLYGRQITLFFSGMAEVERMVDRLPELGQIGLAIAIHLPAVQYREFEAELERGSGFYAALILDIDNNLSIEDIKMCVSSKMVRDTALTIVCDADILLRSDLHESFGGKYITFVPRRSSTDTWVAQLMHDAESRPSGIMISETDRVFCGETALGTLQAFEPNTFFHLVEGMATELRLALAPDLPQFVNSRVVT